MTLFWKGAAALGLAIAAIGVGAVPAQAQYYGGHGYRDGWRGDRGAHDRRWHDRRHWDNRRHWRHGRHHHARPHYRGYRPRCWTEWRRGYYGDRRVRVCR
ncbi:MAG: hypothetical protein AB7E60_04340 [Sphingobium sp.]